MGGIQGMPWKEEALKVRWDIDNLNRQYRLYCYVEHHGRRIEVVLARGSHDYLEMIADEHNKHLKEK